MDIIERGRVLANKSIMQQKHSCIITHNGDIVSEGYNQWVNRWCHKWSLHAEVVALNKVKHMPKWWLKECKMYVFRLSNTDPTGFRMSRPCRDCTTAIERACIGKVYYTSDDMENNCLDH